MIIIIHYIYFRLNGGPRALPSKKRHWRHIKFVSVWRTDRLQPNLEQIRCLKSELSFNLKKIMPASERIQYQSRFTEFEKILSLNYLNHLTNILSSKTTSPISSLLMAMYFLEKREIKFVPDEKSRTIVKNWYRKTTWRYFQPFFYRTNKPISAKLVSKYSLENGVKVCLNEGK